MASQQPQIAIGRISTYNEAHRTLRDESEALKLSVLGAKPLLQRSRCQLPTQLSGV